MKRLTHAVLALTTLVLATSVAADPAAAPSTTATAQATPAQTQSATPVPVQKADQAPPEPAWFERMDTNGNHEISRQEYLDAMGQRFDKLDADHDGNVDMKEWQRVRNQMEKMLRARRKAIQAPTNGAPASSAPAQDTPPNDGGA